MDIMHVFRCGGLLCLIGHVLLLFRGNVASASEVNSTNIFPPRNWTWSINEPDVKFYTSGQLKPLLVYNDASEYEFQNVSFMYGFFSPQDAEESLFGIVSLQNRGRWSDNLNLVWSANRNEPVKENATLQLSEDEGLVLRDVDGSLVWSTKNTTNPVVIKKMNLTEGGNLVLYDWNDTIVWESFDHPTDTLLPGQTLRVGRNLTSRLSERNLSEGLYSLLASDTVLRFFYGTQEYLKGVVNGSYIQTQNTLGGFLRLDHDGHLRRYFHDNSSVGSELEKLDIPCAYPMACGNYGVCTGERRCACADKYSHESPPTYFMLNDANKTTSGCHAITELSCPSSQHDGLLTLEGVSYFNFNSTSAIFLNRTSKEHCQDACLNNCSCKAAMVFSDNGDLNGYCYLQSEIFSLKKGYSGDWQHPFSPNESYTTYLKVVQDAPPSSSRSSKSTTVIVGSVIGGSVGVLLAIIAIIILLVKKGRFEKEVEEEEDYLITLTGLPTKFSYQELTVATLNFQQKLGEGGFGSVFKGTLADDRRVAVKRLESITQGTKEFLAELEIISSIQHLNLVELLGFCANKLHRVLVYEYMCNGSLDKWIFQKALNCKIRWQVRQKIINQVAQGLRYLHEQCIHKIAHLDIKPQNILLDENFNAKLSDFGLSKLIDRDQSNVITMMRGTPGYLAPEWLTSIITEKVDVYSFGVVLAEIICGRKNLDPSQSDENAVLLNELKDKATQDHLSDIISKYCAKIDINKEEAIQMLRLALWCSHGDHTKRPSMSTILKVLEGAMKVDHNLAFDFLTLPNDVISKAISVPDSASLSIEVPSGPR